jgi:hypothetical protein
MTDEEIQEVINEFRPLLTAMAKKEGISEERSIELDKLIIEIVQNALRRKKNGD